MFLYSISTDAWLKDSSLLLGRGKNSDSWDGLCWNYGWRATFCHWDNSPGFLIGLLWSHLGASLQSDKGGSIVFSLPLHGRNGALVYSVVFGYNKVVIVIKFSDLLGCSFPGPLPTENRLLLEGYFVYPYRHFQVASLFTSMFEVHEEKRNLRALSTVFFLRFQVS